MAPFPSFATLRASVTSVCLILVGSLSAAGQSPLPVLTFPDPRIAEVYRANWENSLLPAQEAPDPPGGPAPMPNEEPERPWRVDLEGHYPGWYPGVDVKHMAAAYLACEKNLPLVLRAWDLSIGPKYLLADGSVRPMTFHDNPHSVVPETTQDGSVVYYPLRLTSNIDMLLLGDMIFRFSQDRDWLEKNLPVLRKVAGFIEAWLDPEGLLHSDSYDVDQVYREIDGVANASAILAFRRLAELETVSGNEKEGKRFQSLAARISAGVEKHFWSEANGYYLEHLAYNNVAQSNRLGSLQGASSELDDAHGAARVLDGIRGTGSDAFGAGSGAGGQNEWATRGETVGSWIQIGFSEATPVGSVILFNRTTPSLAPGERFAAGRLEFSDGSAPVEVLFNRLDISRAFVSFEPRTVTWIKFTGTEMQGTGGANAGLAEFMALPPAQPYRSYTHGMTDTNFALLGFDAIDKSRATSAWSYFKQHEAAFYEVDGLFAPTWIAEKAVEYGPGELNKRAPHKDCVAMARTWRYDALMRQQQGDGAGLYKTITYVNGLFDRPSGGGTGYFAERYGLGRFQPGDEAEATVAKYTEYPAVYNSTIVQQTLLGLDVDAWGTITVDPCVPESWYEAGFSQDGCGVLKDRDIAYEYGDHHVRGSVSGVSGTQRLRLRLPRALAAIPGVVRVAGNEIPVERKKDWVTMDLKIVAGEKTRFAIQARDELPSSDEPSGE
jgi:hypothetical protein